jgi:type VI secretion system protein ImpE
LHDDPRDLLKANDPEGALRVLREQVRAWPADPRLRVFLFQLLCVMGDWNRAITQLKLCAELDPEATTMARAYREAIICEVFREKVFAGQKEPLIFGEPKDWIALLVEALKALAQDDAARAATLRERAFAAAPETPGEINGTPFAWIADADMRLGPVLEVIVNGRYFWMPFLAIAVLRTEAPSDLRDTVWTPGHVTLRNGGEMVALIPTRYPSTPVEGGGAARLARTTDWIDTGEGTFRGIGQRLLATDTGETALMDLRSLQMHAAPEATGRTADD